MEDRKRFESTWNGIAVIIMFGGIFLGFRPAGYSAWGIAIFMWVIGGTVANIIYGPKSKGEGTTTTPGIIENTKTKYCASCGEENRVDAEFCIQCGTSMIEGSKIDTTKMK